MTRLAHLSDLHLDGSPGRRANFLRALGMAACNGCDYLIVSGDLTEHGAPREFAEAAGVLSAWPWNRVTVVPGNHDGTDADWQSALSGPLSPYAAHSLPGSVTDLGDVRIVSMDTHVAGRAPIFRALGGLGRGQVSLVAALGADSEQTDRPVVLVMHHGPQLHWLHPLEGLVNRGGVNQILRRYWRLYVCCGHDHETADVGRVFVAPSTVDHPEPLRVYDVVGPTLVSRCRGRPRGQLVAWAQR